MSFIEEAYNAGLNQAVQDFEKIAGPKNILGLVGAGAAGAAAGAGLLTANAMLAGTDQAKKSHIGSARGAAHIIADAEYQKKNNKGHYYFNPTVTGPIREATSRLQRRHSASMAEKPGMTATVPLYGMIRGGKAGEDIMQKKAFVNASGVFPGILGDTEAGRKSAKARAKGHAETVASSKNARKNSIGQYLLNPHVDGIGSELASRYGRRMNAAKAEAPLASRVVPIYGLARGGQAGTKIMKEKNKISDVF